MKTIILAGGTGTRLWPLSRSRYPKQFIRFNGESYSLFQKTFLRALKISNNQDIIIVTSEEYPFIVEGQIRELNQKIPKENIIVEPLALNTLPAIASGVFLANKVGTFIVMPSDHQIENEDEFWIYETSFLGYSVLL